MTTDYYEGDLVYVKHPQPGKCSHCGRQIDGSIGIVDRGFYGFILVSLVDRSWPRKLCCSAEELQIVPAGALTIHASPSDVRSAIDVGWLEPGFEFYGCEFRVIQAAA